MRGYFGFGVERVSKPMNLGAILRTSHAFGAHFAFTMFAHPRAEQIHKSDTSKLSGSIPLYAWRDIGDTYPEGVCLLG